MVLSSVIAGASGGALANVALSPLGGGAGLLQSYWYGAGLILGERMMYTFHWEKMKKRLDTGEDFLQVLESEMNPAITAIADYSLQVMKKTGALYMQGGIDFMAKLIENMLKLLAGETITDVVEPEPVPVTEPTIDCPSGFRWSASAQQCVPEDIPEPDSTPIVDPLIDDSPKIVRPPDSVIINIAIGKTRHALASGVMTWGLWSRKDLSIAGSDLSNWIRAVIGKFTKASSLSTGNSVWTSANYMVYEITQDYYWVLLKDL